MMKELHHRVKNNLQIISSLLSLQSYKLKDDEALEAIRLSQQRVQAMSFIHQRLYTTDQTRLVNMKEYLQDLTLSLVMAYGFDEGTMDLDVRIAHQWLDVDKALPLGLIANEVTTNALKYAFKGDQRPALSIGLAEEGENLLFTVKDNGRGWDLRRWEQPGASFGRQLVETLCRQLRAKQQLSYLDGSVFAFAIPLK
jgi:two-component sensor histidine kinase